MRHLSLVFVWLSLGVFAVAQNYVYDTGNLPFSTDIPIDNGYIDVNNGEIHLDIPLAAQAVRGTIPLHESLEYDSRIWEIINNNGTVMWWPNNINFSTGGWRVSTGLTTNGNASSPTYAATIEAWTTCNGQDYPSVMAYTNFAWTDPSGSNHLFPGSFQQQVATPCNSNITPQSITATALDGSGYTMKMTYDTSSTAVDTVVYDRLGNEVCPILMDPNGNYYSEDSNQNLIDTLGRTPVVKTTNGNQIYLDVLSFGGNTVRYTITTEHIDFQTNFNQSGVTELGGFFTAIQSIQLPDGSSYSFTYDSGTSQGHYGEMTSVTLPSGGVIGLSYQKVQDSFSNDNLWLSKVTKDNANTQFFPSVLSYCSGGTACQEQTEVVNPDGNSTVYTFTLDPSTYTNGGSWNTETDNYQGRQSGGTKLRSVVTNYTYNVRQILNADGTTSTYSVPQTQDVLTSLISPSATWTAQTNTTFDAFGANPTDVQQWDYYNGSAGLPAEETVYTYGYSVNGANFPTDITVRQPLGNNTYGSISDTKFGHDETAPILSIGVPHHTAPSGPPYGDVTSVSKFVNTTGTYQTTTATYDDAGEVVWTIDPNGKTTYQYGGADFLVRSVTPPTPSSGVSLTWYTDYDFSSSLVTDTIDPNSQTTYYKNYDAFGRVGEIDYPDGGKTTFGYSPTSASIHQYQNASVYDDTEIQYDGYGRESRRAIANGQGTNPWYQTDTCYDANGRINFESYRYQGTGFGMSKVCSGAGDTLSYDALSRPNLVTHGDGTSVTYNNQLRATQITDENGVSRIVQNDAFGRTTEVCEISSNSNMPGSGSPSSCGLDVAGTGFLTTLQYYSGGQDVVTTQGAQMRWLETDSLGRMSYTHEPEGGQTNYTYLYNSTGLQVTRTRPEANQTNPNFTTTTTTQYDTLGRPVSITYSDGTPSKSYSYDVAQQWGITVQNPAGRLAAESTSSNTGAIFGYDPVGRVVLRNECTPSTCGSNSFQTAYSYDWVGNLLSSGDGFVTNSYIYSVANEVQSITSSLNDANDPPNILSSVQNGPFGPLNWQLGNGLNGVRNYDTLGRVNGGWLCQGSTQAFCSGGSQVYGFTETRTGPYVTSACDTVLNACGNYGYDEFGRLNALNIYSGNATSFSYVYDRWGNRWQQNAVGGGGGPQPHATFDSYNKITTYGYDAAGNVMTDDGAHTYSYDAEGNLTLVDGGATSKNTYDAENQRVRIDNAGQPSVEFVFNPFGQRVSVWDATNGWQSQGQTYWGTAPVEFYNNGYAHYQHQDWLGTERLATNNAAQVEGTYTSLPFGDGFSVNGTDDDTYHFAALDYDYNSGYNGTEHAQFRQYYNANGLWMSPDPYIASYDFTNPQSFNRYSYVLNNPASVTDSSGLEGGGCGVWCIIPPIIGCLFFCGPGGGAPHPVFHGTLTPRPNREPWDEYHIQYGPDISGAFGLPDAGCEFGACGAGPASFTSGIGSLSSNSLLKSIIGQVELAALFFGQSNASSGSNYYRVTCFGNPSGLSYSKRGCVFACGGEEEIGPFNEFPTAGFMFLTQKQLIPVCGSNSEAFCPSQITAEGNYIPGSGWASNPYLSDCRMGPIIP